MDNNGLNGKGTIDLLCGLMEFRDLLFSKTLATLIPIDRYQLYIFKEMIQYHQEVKVQRTHLCSLESRSYNWDEKVKTLMKDVISS